MDFLLVSILDFLFLLLYLEFKKWGFLLGFVAFLKSILFKMAEQIILYIKSIYFYLLIVLFNNNIKTRQYK